VTRESNEEDRSHDGGFANDQATLVQEISGKMAKRNLEGKAQLDRQSGSKGMGRLESSSVPGQ
jgi:hypothetical protein